MTREAEVRRAGVKEEPALLALVPRLVAFGPPSWRDADEMTEVDRSHLRAALRATSDDPAVFVATVGGDIVGFSHVHSFVDHYRGRPHAHLSDLVVAEGHEGQGIAGLLIGRAETWAREHGYDWLSLSVFSDNVRAERLYGRLGFRRDTIRMIRPLD